MESVTLYNISFQLCLFLEGIDNLLGNAQLYQRIISNDLYVAILQA